MDLEFYKSTSYECVYKVLVEIKHKEGISCVDEYIIDTDKDVVIILTCNYSGGEWVPFEANKDLVYQAERLLEKYACDC